MIRIENANKIYTSKKGMLSKEVSTQALKEINLDIKKGETLGLVGESGSGKSTLGRCLLTLEKLSGGQLYYNDVLVTDKNIKEYTSKLQVIFQDPYSSLNPTRSALESVMEPLLLHTDKKRAKEKALEILKLVGIGPDQANKLAKSFSGGQRQRIGIARAIITNPEFIVCDEPTSALDVSIQIQILDLLKELQREFELTYLFISHDLSVVSYICDRVAVMYKGQIVEIAPTKELYDNPQHPYTKKLLDSRVILNPKQARTKLLKPTANNQDITLSDHFIFKEINQDHFVRIEQ